MRRILSSGNRAKHPSLDDWLCTEVIRNSIGNNLSTHGLGGDGYLTFVALMK